MLKFFNLSDLADRKKHVRAKEPDNDNMEGT